MILTDGERNKFATYLEETARDNEAMAEQVLRLPGSPIAMAKQLRTEAAAAMIIASKLRATNAEAVLGGSV